MREEKGTNNTSIKLRKVEMRLEFVRVEDACKGSILKESQNKELQVSC